MTDAAPTLDPKTTAAMRETISHYRDQAASLAGDPAGRAFCTYMADTTEARIAMLSTLIYAGPEAVYNATREIAAALMAETLVNVMPPGSDLVMEQFITDFVDSFARKYNGMMTGKDAGLVTTGLRTHRSGAN